MRVSSKWAVPATIYSAAILTIYVRTAALHEALAPSPASQVCRLGRMDFMTETTVRHSGFAVLVASLCVGYAPSSWLFLSFC